MEVLYTMMKYRGYITPIPYGEVQCVCVPWLFMCCSVLQVMLFSAASAVLLPAFRFRDLSLFFTSYVCSVVVRSEEGLHDAIGSVLK